MSASIALRSVIDVLQTISTKIWPIVILLLLSCFLCTLGRTSFRLALWNCSGLSPKHDFEKNAIENFRHCHSCNLTQAIDRCDVLYQMVAWVLVKLSNKRARTFQRLDMIWKFRILYIDHYCIITIIDDSLQNCSGLLWEMKHLGHFFVRFYC